MDRLLRLEMVIIRKDIIHFQIIQLFIYSSIPYKKYQTKYKQMHINWLKRILYKCCITVYSKFIEYYSGGKDYKRVYVTIDWMKERVRVKWRIWSAANYLIMINYSILS